MGSPSLGHVGITYQIWVETNDFSYIKQISHSRYGLEMPNPHDLITTEITEAQKMWFSEGDGCNMVWTLVNQIYSMVHTMYNR